MRLSGLIIKNYRRVGEIECKIKIDQIVVLVGQNNSGKSTVLDAYELFASGGKEVDASHFHNGDAKRPIEIIGVFNKLTDEDRETLGKQWEHDDPDHGSCIKVKWVWSAPSQRGQKQAYRPGTGSYEAGGLGGWDSLLQSRVPRPVRIRPTDPVDTTQTKIVGMLKDHIKTKLKADSSGTTAVLAEIEKLAAQLYEESKGTINDISNKITEQVSTVFPGTVIEVIPRSKDAIDEKIIAADSYLKIGTSDGNGSSLVLQGTGLQRALLWSALSVMSDLPSGKKKAANEEDEPPRVLLIDEPEAFLHPPTVRMARDALYDFALKNPNWQVIATTHSPVFIDVAKDHTTIIRVDASSPQRHYVSTDEVGFKEPERKRLAMVRACHPFVNEFFFFDEIILVEGPTENVVVSTLAEILGKQVHVIDCLGKANIPMFAKILNHFQVPYVVIHDSDVPRAKRKDKIIANPMWAVNEEIRKTVAESKAGANIFVQFPNFEGAFCPEELRSGKVDNVIAILADESSEYRARILNAYDKVFAKDEAVMCNSEGAFKATMDKHMAERGLGGEWAWQQ
ncbi:Predicted ATP-dependent endonuclease of the OLD family, contains P-loop ATPase and TOPRIM domains [Xaviernesmea oryzae]|uniref:Predicted ATP-dependent endonuclease of the OLD family, contains P-loop ATPase and TOPRIM domains n=1 Tax=Xaviernesmea oryzae TaxID=464029 RepID=A0A1X7G7G3_9HYPH|nr:AAA family ATPase [Xaviernesmea oryzae]SMF65295.1 Predicted ATP-dependent endonuclease of the OLD family, contains P-loop ATPase and TOPRIM domains [Xaviernesmea oryzae]